MTDVLDDTAPVRRRYGQPDEELQAVYDAQPLKVKCGLCVWEYEGPAGEARVAQHEHRLVHAAAKPADRKPAAARSQGLTAADRRAVHPKDDREETPVRACKIDGCTEEPGLDKRGPYTGLCSAHKREKAAAMGAARRAERQPTPAAPVAPAATSNGHQPLTLVQLAQAVEQADADILAALERRSRAVADLQAWIDADE